MEHSSQVAQADRASSSGRVGKRVGGYVYVHRSVFSELDVPLRTLLSRAQALVGDVEWNVAKLGLDGCTVSLLKYDEFFNSPFPELSISYRVSIADKTVRVLKYGDNANRPVLHRKELLLSAEHPRRCEYAQLTAQLLAAGLLGSGYSVGYSYQWRARLANAGYCIDGHVLRHIGREEPGRDRHTIQRHRTALRRYKLSRPMQALARHGYFDGKRALFDYGCGRGDDLRLLEIDGIPVTGWDPYFRPDAAKVSAPLVNLGFVINVIEEPDERARVLVDAFAHAQELLVVGVMLEGASANQHRVFADGVLTSRGTFQKYFTQKECKAFIEEVLEIEPVPVAPGIFFVFRRESDAQAFLERRVVSHLQVHNLLQRVSMLDGESQQDTLYWKHQKKLEPLWRLYLELGRPPSSDEVMQLEELNECFGSLRRALRYLERHHGEALIAEAARARTADIRVYLALQLFKPRQRFSTYSVSVQRDIKTFFGSMRTATELAQSLLYSIGDPKTIEAECIAAAGSDIGFLDHEQHSLTLQTGDVERLPEKLRVYVGCATHLYGDPRAADLVKIHAWSGKLSLMRYDDFEGSVLPLLTERVKIDFRWQTIELFEYGEAYPSPYLYKKSRYVGKEFPNYDKQKEFDQNIDELKLFDFSGYGPQKEKFDDALRRLRLEVKGFDLTDATDVPNLDELCGKYHSFRDFIECGETQAEHGICNVPKEPETYNALAQLAREVIDPVMDYFGGIRLTYGFCGAALARKVPGRIDPSRDQHAGYEYNARRNRICNRLGAATDFLIEDENMADVALWIVENCHFDRIYYYGANKPLHVSVGPDNTGSVVHMIAAKGGRRIPRNLKNPKIALKELAAADS